MSDTTNTPNQPDASAPAGPTKESSSATPTSTSPTSRKRKLLVAGGSVLAAVLLAGGGIAVGSAIADEQADDGDGVSAGADLGATSADELIQIIDAASSAADGTAVSIDAGSDGSWDVEFRTGSGDEIEVRVASDGTATVISTEAADRDDPEPQGGLDAATLKALVAAAVAEVDGRIVDLEVDDDTTSPYEVSVLTASGGTVDLALDAELNVLATEADD